MKGRLYALSISMVLLLSACDDVFVTDISNDSVIVLCPTDGYTGNSAEEVIFWWEELNGAESYSIQIVTPRFDSIRHLIVDARLDTTKYSVSLPEGDYQWRIKALNSYYSGKYSTYTLHIGTEVK